MSDLYCDWHNDLQVSSNGDLLVVDGNDESKQRIIRRLCTAVNSYIFHLDYGVGIPQKVGDKVQDTVLQALVQSQMINESSVSQNPPPVVTITRTGLSIVNIYIEYITIITGETVSFSLTV